MPSSNGIQTSAEGSTDEAHLIYRGGLNLMEDGTVRTIKNQYFKNSTDNFLSHGTFGATGVIEIYEIRES